MSNVQVYHIEIDEETDFSARFIYTNLSTGLPMDLTGYRAEMQVRKGYDGVYQTLPIMTLTTETNGGIVLGGELGTIDIFIAYADTMEQDWNEGMYKLIIISPTSGRVPFARGFFTISPNVTRLANTALPNIVSGTVTHPNNKGEGGLDGS